MFDPKGLKKFDEEDFCKVFINKYYKKDPRSPKSLFDLPEKERYIKLLIFGFNDDFRKEYGITLESFVKWYSMCEVLADLVDLRKPTEEEYKEWCDANNLEYTIINSSEFTYKPDWVDKDKDDN